MVPDGTADGAEEIVRAAAQTGAHMHYCHINSTSQRHIDRVLGLVGRAQAAGSRVTTEAYPYGSGMTGIGAAFLAPERLGERGLEPSSLTYAPTGERVASEERLRELRRTDPGGPVLIDLLNEDDPADQDLLLRSLTFPGSVVASDAMPLTWTTPADKLAWPLPPGAITHPRTAGTFSRALRLLTRERGTHDLPAALAKCSLDPARLLQDHVPAMRRKGRLQPGADADVIVFDPTLITDQATYQQSTRPSTGIRHVLVNGEFVVRDGDLVTDARPGTRNPRDKLADLDIRDSGAAGGLSFPWLSFEFVMHLIISGELPSLQCSIYGFPCSSYLCSNIRHGSVPRSRGEVSRVSRPGRGDAGWCRTRAQAPLGARRLAAPGRTHPGRRGAQVKADAGGDMMDDDFENIDDYEDFQTLRARNQNHGPGERAA